MGMRQPKRRPRPPAQYVEGKQAQKNFLDAMQAVLRSPKVPMKKRKAA